MKTFDDIVSKILENPDFNQFNEDILNLQKNIKEILDNRENLVGRRVKMVYTSDAYTDVVPGDTGTVSHVDDAGTVFVNWDSGSGLGLIPGIDIFEVISA